MKKYKIFSLLLVISLITVLMTTAIVNQSMYPNNDSQIIIDDYEFEKPKSHASNYIQVCKDSNLSLGAWSASNGWSWNKYFYGVFGNIDANDYADYETSSPPNYLFLTIFDDASFGADEWERVYVYQFLPSIYYFADLNNITMNIEIDWQFIKGSGSGALSELSDIDFRFGINDNYNWLLDSYYDADNSHAYYNSGSLTTLISNLDVSSYISYPYCLGDLKISLRLDSKSIAFDTYVDSFIDGVRIWANVTTTAWPDLDDDDDDIGDDDGGSNGSLFESIPGYHLGIISAFSILTIISILYLQIKKRYN